MKKFLIIIVSIVVLATFCSCNKVDFEGIYDESIESVDAKGTQKSIVEKVNGYLAHPDTVLTASGSILCCYVNGHGRGKLNLKVSNDNGKTWQVRQTPSSWAKSEETPTLYRLQFVDNNGEYTQNEKIVMVTGCPGWQNTGSNATVPNGWGMSVSNDDGKTFTELEYYHTDDYDVSKDLENSMGTIKLRDDGSAGYPAIVAMASLTQLKENGKLVNKWLGIFHDYSFYNYKTILTFDDNGVSSWSTPEELYPSDIHQSIEAKYQLCETETIRFEDKLILLHRANRKISNSFISVSCDEGATWSVPKELPNELSGERHKACFIPGTTTLMVSYRQIYSYKDENGQLATHTFTYNDIEDTYTSYKSGSWYAWLGDINEILAYADDDTSNDSHNGKLIRLGYEYGGAGDCGYSGITCTLKKDYALFTVVGYGRFNPSAGNPYIMAVRYKVKLDK